MFNGNQLSPPRHILRVAILEGLTDGLLTQPECNASRGSWIDGECWLERQPVVAVGLAAVDDFNSRNATYAPQYASPEVQACDKQLSISVLDSHGLTKFTLGQIIGSLGSSLQPHSIVGPQYSSVAIALAPMTGVLEIPLVRSARQLPCVLVALRTSMFAPPRRSPRQQRLRTWTA